MGYEESKVEGRNAVLEAFRSGKTIDKVFILDGCQDGPVRTIVREARKNKDWAEADRIRDELKARNIVLKDTPMGVKWSYEK